MFMVAKSRSRNCEMICLTKLPKKTFWKGLICESTELFSQKEIIDDSWSQKDLSILNDQ